MCIRDRYGHAILSTPSMRSSSVPAEERIINILQIDTHGIFLVTTECPLLPNYRILPWVKVLLFTLASVVAEIVVVLFSAPHASSVESLKNTWKPKHITCIRYNSLWTFQQLPFYIVVTLKSFLRVETVWPRMYPQEIQYQWPNALPWWMVLTSLDPLYKLPCYESMKLT